MVGNDKIGRRIRETLWAIERIDDEEGRVLFYKMLDDALHSIILGAKRFRKSGDMSVSTKKI